MKLIEDYREYLNLHYNNEGSVIGYISDAVSLIDFLAEKKFSQPFAKLNEVHRGRVAGSLTLTEYYLYLNEQQKSFSAATVNRRISSHKKFIYFLYENSFIEKDFSGEIKSIRLNTKSKSYLSEEECLELIESCKGMNLKRDRAIIALLLFSGLRVNEIRNLKRSDINDNYLYVQTSENDERKVELNDALRAILSDFIISDRNYAHDNLFCNSTGNHLSLRTIHQIIKKHLSACDIHQKGIGSEVLRRTGANLLIKYSDASISEIKNYLGHKNISTTENYFESNDVLNIRDLNNNPVAKGIVKMI